MSQKLLYKNSLLDIVQPGTGWYVPVFLNQFCVDVYAPVLFITTHREI